VPHDVLLPNAAVVVTHAGLGTVLAALRHGLPLLCVPIGRDQPGNAAWVQSSGAGRALPVDAGLGDLTAAMRDLLSAGAPERAAARRLARIFAGYRGADAAVGTIERAVSANNAARV
jgi:UDP:flavonoid glycosyltransferase YjiC (YdhE family)